MYIFANYENGKLRKINKKINSNVRDRVQNFIDWLGGNKTAIQQFSQIQGRYHQQTRIKFVL